jgi:hypothetical protein
VLGEVSAQAVVKTASFNPFNTQYLIGLLNKWNVQFKPLNDAV